MIFKTHSGEMDEPRKNTKVQAIRKKFEKSYNNADKITPSVKPIGCSAEKNFVPDTSAVKTESYDIQSNHFSNSISKRQTDKVRGLIRRPPVSRRPENIRLNCSGRKVGGENDANDEKIEQQFNYVVKKSETPVELCVAVVDNERRNEDKKWLNIISERVKPDEEIPIPIPRKRNRLRSNNGVIISDSSHCNISDHKDFLADSQCCCNIESSPTKTCIHQRLKALHVEKNKQSDSDLHHRVKINDNELRDKKMNDGKIVQDKSANNLHSKINNMSNSQFFVPSLPPGPPPEKPPRTFEHDIYIHKKHASHTGKKQPTTSEKHESDNMDSKVKMEHEYDEVLEQGNYGIVQKNASKFEMLSTTENSLLKHSKRQHNHVSHLKYKSLFPFFNQSGDDSVKSHNIHLREDSGRSSQKKNLRKTYSECPELSLTGKEKIQMPTKSFVSPYAVADLHSSLSPNRLSLKLSDIKPVAKSRSQFFVELNNGNGIKRYASDEHIYEEPGVVKSNNTNHIRTLTRTLSADSEEFYIKNIEYDTIVCESNNESETTKPTPNLRRGLHYLSSPINIQRFRTRSFSELSQKNSFIRHERENDIKKHHDKASKPSRVVPVAVRELINQSFHRVSNYQRSNSTLNPPIPDDDSGDSDSELAPSEVQKRIEYIRTVSRVSSVKYDRLNRSGRLFDYVLVVGLQCTEKTGLFEPYIKLSHPPLAKSHFEKWVPHVSFPDAEFWKPSVAGETYMSVFTDEKGKRTFGYCRRIKPDGCSVSLPIVYCIISPVMDFIFFKRILEELEKMYGHCDSDMLTFLKHLHQKPLPKLGAEITVHNQFLNTNEVIKRSENPAVDSYGLDTLLSSLDVTNLVKVFAALLLERKVLLHSSSISQLSQCVQGLYNLLYPFSWDHTFVPVLPGCAIEVLCSPMPFLIGILNDAIPKLQDLSISDVLMIDLDKNRMQHEVGDELKVIPKKLQKSLIEALKSAKSIPPTSKSIMISEAFLRIFVETVGSYSNYIVTQQDGKKVFEKEPFCLGAPLKSATSFLLWFTETQMFYSFIDSHLDGTAVMGLFDNRVQDYNEEMNNLPLSFRENIKEFGKKFKNIGEKLIGFKSPAKLETKSLEKVKQAEI